MGMGGVPGEGKGMPPVQPTGAGYGAMPPTGNTITSAQDLVLKYFTTNSVHSDAGCSIFQCAEALANAGISLGTIRWELASLFFSVSKFCQQLVVPVLCLRALS